MTPPGTCLRYRHLTTHTLSSNAIPSRSVTPPTHLTHSHQRDLLVSTFSNQQSSLPLHQPQPPSTVPSPSLFFFSFYSQPNSTGLHLIRAPLPHSRPAFASHAIITHTLFTVCYKPRTSQFIIRLNKYLEAVKNRFSVGMRFKMQFEGEDSPVKRFTGTIVGVGDVSSRWTDSEWRSLKVQWDEAAALQRPERVSPWEIEPFDSSVFLNQSQPIPTKNKKPRPSIDVPALEPSSGFWYPGSTQSCDLGALSSTEAQSHESHIMWSPKQKEIKGNISNSSGLWTTEQQEDVWLKDLHVPFTNQRECPSSFDNVSLKLFTDQEESKEPLSLHIASGYSTIDHILKLGNESNVVATETGKRPENRNGYRLFGINLFGGSNSAAIEKTSEDAISISGAISIEPTPASISAIDSDQSGPSKASREQKQSSISPKEIQSKHGCTTTTTRSRTKVHMQGIAVGRAVDLTMLDGYDNLIMELEKLFEIEGELHNRKKWEIAFTDNEGDMMLMGDDPWPEFCSMVKKIFIYTCDEVKKMNSRSKLHSSQEVQRVFSKDSELT